MYIEFSLPGRGTAFEVHNSKTSLKRLTLQVKFKVLFTVKNPGAACLIANNKENCVKYAVW